MLLWNQKAGYEENLIRRIADAILWKRKINMKKVYLLYDCNGKEKSLMAVYGTRESAEMAKSQWLEKTVAKERGFLIECWQIN